ncbi:MAG: DoxX family protein [bacterium]|nr:DoxX family protein [bacterium]
MIEQFVSIELILLFSRLVLGGVMLYYGYPKIKDLRKNAQETSEMGFKPGMFWGTIIASVEFFGGIAIIVGLYADIWAALYGFICITGAFWKLKIKSRFMDCSYELMLLALCATLLGLGTGAPSLTPLSGLQFLHIYAVSAAITLGLLFAYLPEMLGKKYRDWEC